MARHPAARRRASGLFDWIRVIEVVLGVTILLNRMMLLSLVALAPLNMVIAWPPRHYFWPMLTWRGRPDYGLATGWPPAREA